MSPYRSITEATQLWLAPYIQGGDQVLDATAGNGGDTVWLADKVGPEGRVWALDCQDIALENTLRRLHEADFQKRCVLVRGDHARIEADLPAEAQTNLAAVIFNLGYLPGSDKRLTTQAVSTLHALDQTSGWLRSGGVLAVVCYPGHPAGAIEADAVTKWFEDTAQAINTRLHNIRTGPTKRPAPFLLGLQFGENAAFT